MSDPSDAALFVQFHPHPVIDPIATKEAGHKVYRDDDYIKIVWDNGMSELDIPVREVDKDRFAKQWEAYQAGRDQQMIGLPLDKFFIDEPSKVMNYKVKGIHTVEQLAEVSESSLQGLGLGAHEDCQRAKDYLDASSRDKILAERDAKLEELKDANAMMAEQMKDMQKQMAEMLAAQSKGKSK